MFVRSKSSRGFIDISAEVAAESCAAEAGFQKLPAAAPACSLAEQLAELNLRAVATAILDALEAAATGEHVLAVRVAEDGEPTRTIEIDGQRVTTFRIEDAERLAGLLVMELRGRPRLAEICCALFEASL